jgi:hypothetical protein
MSSGAPLSLDAPGNVKRLAGAILAARVCEQLLQGEEPRHFVVAVSTAKEHNPSRKELEYYR